MSRKKNIGDSNRVYSSSWYKRKGAEEHEWVATQAWDTRVTKGLPTWRPPLSSSRSQVPCSFPHFSADRWGKHQGVVQAYNIQVVNNLSNRQNADNGLTTEKQGKKKRELEIVRLKMLRCSFFTMPMKLELTKHRTCCSGMQNMSDNILCLEQL